MTAPRQALGYYVPTTGPHEGHRLVATLEAWWCEECRQGLSVDDVRHLTESQRAMIAARVSNLRPGGDRKSDQAANLQFDSRSVASAAKSLNVGEKGEIAERCIGLAIRKGQKEGKIRKSGTVGRGTGAASLRGDHLPSTKKYFNSMAERYVTYAMTDNVPDEAFEKAIAEAKECDLFRRCS